MIISLHYDHYIAYDCLLGGLGGRVVFCCKDFGCARRDKCARRPLIFSFKNYIFFRRFIIFRGGHSFGLNTL